MLERWSFGPQAWRSLLRWPPHDLFAVTSHAPSPTEGPQNTIGLEG